MTIHIESMLYTVCKVCSMEEAIKSTRNKCVKKPAVVFKRRHLHIDRKLPFLCPYSHVMLGLNKKAFYLPQKLLDISRMRRR